MANGVASDVYQAASALTGKQFLDYDPSYQTSGSQVLVERLSEIPELAALDEAVRLGDVPYDAGGRGVVAMVHAVGTGANKVVAYRLKGPGIATRRARGITLIPRDGVHGPIGDDVLFYEPGFDLVTCGELRFSRPSPSSRRNCTRPTRLVRGLLTVRLTRLVWGFQAA
jgi:hypothetical protein